LEGSESALFSIEERSFVMGMVTCGGCGIKFDRVSQQGEYIKNKWYHPGCARIKHDRIKLDDYIKKLFNLKALGPMNNVLIKKYKEEFGFTYQGMLNSLKYFYEVRKHNIDNSEERVGIIPYVYNEAQEYYQTIEKNALRIANNAITTKPEEIKIELCNTKKENKNNNISELNSLFDEE